MPRRFYIILGILIAAPVGFLYWWYADWWAYVHRGGDEPPTPKFEMPLWWQIGESALVGCVAGTLVCLLIWMIKRKW